MNYFCLKLFRDQTKVPFLSSIYAIITDGIYINHHCYSIGLTCETGKKDRGFGYETLFHLKSKLVSIVFDEHDDYFLFRTSMNSFRFYRSVYTSDALTNDCGQTMPMNGMKV